MTGSAGWFPRIEIPDLFGPGLVSATKLGRSREVALVRTGDMFSLVLVNLDSQTGQPVKLGGVVAMTREALEMLATDLVRAAFEGEK